MGNVDAAAEPCDQDLHAETSHVPLQILVIAVLMTGILHRSFSVLL